MKKAFISHSSKDNPFALKIAELLVELGVDVWIDLNGIAGGSYWAKKIQAGLDESEAMLLILSPDSMHSDNVWDEWQYFRGQGKRIVPLLFRPTQIPFQLYGLQYIDFIGRPFAAAFADLCMALKSYNFRIGSSNKQRPVLKTGVSYNAEPAIKPGRLTYFDDDGSQHRLPPPGGRPLTEVGEPSRFLPTFLRRVEDILPQPFEWVEINDGEVTLIDGRLNRDAGFPLPTYSLARYSITNAQFQVFADAKDGYRSDGWWNFSHSARRWREAHPEARPTRLPDDHPRVGVAWFEAIAFCRWLAFCVGAEHSVPNITLPTVQQWHWAAVADTGWPYPWGDRFVRRYANTAESRFGHTTPVTQFPFGASTYGVMDMCGNNWEWCLNDWVTGATDIRSESERRFVMGGSWDDTRDFACVQHQPCRKPGIRKNTQGFRIAATFERR